jgi:outer membrane lipoprotein SlyB
METGSIHKTHPLILGAAASVMVVSLVGAAAIGGLLPNAHSDKTDGTAAASVTNAASTGRDNNGAPKLPAYANMCDSCGTVASIHTVLIKGDATGLGAVAGGVTGALVGNQIGRGNGNTAMTILGAAGGAFAGHKTEKNTKENNRYRVTVHMDDGSFRTLPQSTAPAVRVGERVRVVDGRVIARS